MSKSGVLKYNVFSEWLDFSRVSDGVLERVKCSERLEIRRVLNGVLAQNQTGR